MGDRRLALLGEHRVLGSSLLGEHKVLEAVTPR